MLDDDISLECEELETECRVRLSGRITIDTSPGLRMFLLQRLASQSCQALTMDFCDIGYVDTSGLAMLVETLKAARTQGKPLRLSGLRERPRYLLETTRLLHLFDEEKADNAAGESRLAEGG